MTTTPVPRARRPRPRGLQARHGTIAAAGFLALTVVAVLIFGYSPTLNPLDIVTGNLGAVEMPEVVGLTQTKSLVELERKRVHGKVTFGFSTTYERGIVMAQHPAAGDAVDRGGTAGIVVSRGAGQVLLPDLAGVAERDARKQLEGQNLVVEVSRAHDEQAEPNTVFRQDPSPGTVVIGGSTVRLRISLGPAARVVPDVAGLGLEGAAFKLGKEGFTLGNVTHSDDPRVVSGAVISTDPAVGVTAARDSAVSVVVSDGPPPVAVPSVTGVNKNVALIELGKLGLVIGEVTQTGPVGDPLDGTVMSQTPAPNTMLRPGQVVLITVRRAAKPPPPPPTTTAVPTTVPVTNPPAAPATTGPR